MLLAACATPDTLTADAPRAEADFAIAPYQFHEECATLRAGDRIDYRFEAKSPVTFHLYYKDGIAFVAPITREEVREASGLYNAPVARRYCVRWEAGRAGALVEFRLRVQRAKE